MVYPYIYIFYTAGIPGNMPCYRRRARRILLDYHRRNRQSHTNLGGPSSESFVYNIQDHKLSLHIITRLLFEYNIILSLYTRRIGVYAYYIRTRGRRICTVCIYNILLDTPIHGAPVL